MDVLVVVFVFCWIITGFAALFVKVFRLLKNARIHRLHPAKKRPFVPSTFAFDDLIACSYLVIEGRWKQVTRDDAMALLNALKSKLHEEQSTYDKSLEDPEVFASTECIHRIAALKPVLRDLSIVIGKMY